MRKRGSVKQGSKVGFFLLFETVKGFGWAKVDMGLVGMGWRVWFWFRIGMDNKQGSVWCFN